MLSYGKGCDACHNSGYKGRAPLYEVLYLSDELRRLILAEAPKTDMRKLARIQGMSTLREAGINMVIAGTTTLDEVLGATNEDEEDLSSVTVGQTQIVTVPEAMPSVQTVTPTSPVAETPVAMVQPDAAPKSEEEKALEAAEKWKMLKSSKQGVTGQN